MKRGRPIKSDVRQNLVEMLAVMGKGYGYEIHRFYNELFPAVTRENIYYNLKKGVKLGEFRLVEVKDEKGEYSWGSTVEKKYYALGPSAEPKGDKKVKEFFEGLKKIKKKKR